MAEEFKLPFSNTTNQLNTMTKPTASRALLGSVEGSSMSSLPSYTTLPKQTTLKLSESLKLSIEKGLEKAQDALEVIVEILSDSENPSILILTEKFKVLYTMIFRVDSFPRPRRHQGLYFKFVSSSSKKLVKRAQPVIKECINWLEYLFNLTQDGIYQMGIEQLNFALKEMDELFPKKGNFIQTIQDGDTKTITITQGNTVVEKVIQDGNVVRKTVRNGNNVVEKVMDGDFVRKKIKEGNTVTESTTRRALLTSGSDLSTSTETPLQETDLQMDALKSENEALQNQIAVMANEMEMLQGALAEAKKEAEEWRVKYNSADDLPLKRSQETPTESAEPTKAEDGSKLMVLLQDAKKESEDWKKKYEKLKGYIELGQELGIMKQ